MQQSPASSYNYPSSPASTHPLYDSGYSTFNYSSPTPSPFHFSSCPYSNDSYYTTSPTYPSYYSPIPYTMPQQPMPYMNSTPLPSSNVCQLPTTQAAPLKRRRPQPPPQLSTSPALGAARKRISDEAIDRLNNFYAIKKRPTEAEKDRLAMECNISLAQVNTWFNNARSRRGDTNPKVAQKLLRQQIDSLHNQVAFLQQQQPTSSSGHFAL